MNKRKSIITAAIFVAGLTIGWYHLRLALKSIFVFKNNEPLASWLCMISGPLSTLPATVLSIFKRKIGGYWLIIGGTVSFITFLILRPTDPVAFGEKISLPMIVLGVLFLLLRTGEQKSETKPDERPQNKSIQPDAD
jgi:hypothetical protein